MAWNPLRAIANIFRGAWQEIRSAPEDISAPTEPPEPTEHPGGSLDYSEVPHPYPASWGPAERQLWDSQFVAGMYGQYDVTDSQYRGWQREFHDGWIDRSHGKEFHVSARNEFFRNSYSSPANFDWEDWRDYMGYG